MYYFWQLILVTIVSFSFIGQAVLRIAHAYKSIFI